MLIVSLACICYYTYWLSSRFRKNEEMLIMSKIIDDLISAEKRKSVLRLFALGKLSSEEIAEGLGITVEEVNSLEVEYNYWLG